MHDAGRVAAELHQRAVRPVQLIRDHRSDQPRRRVGGRSRPGVERRRRRCRGGRGGVAGLQRLAHEHRQRHRWRIQPLAVLGQQRFARVQQLRTRQHVEELHRFGRSRAPSNASLTLMQNASGITIHGGRPSERWFGCFVNKHRINPWSATSLCIQALTPVAHAKQPK